MTAATQDPPSKLYANRWKALVVLALSLLLISLDNTILNTALPSLRDDLGASASELQWIVDSYLLVFAGLLLTAGSLGDRFGRKRALQFGLAVFALGSIGSALAGRHHDADRLARPDGSRRRIHHALDALDHHRDLPGRRAAEGDRRMGRCFRHRHRPRAARRRRPARVLRLELGLLGQRAARRRSR